MKIEVFDSFNLYRLKKAMKRRGITREDLIDGFVKLIKNKTRSIHTERVDEILTFGDWQSQEPNLEELFVICEIVNVSADYLLNLINDVY